MNEYFSRFSKHDYVGNDHKVGQMLRKLLVNKLNWQRVCEMSYDQCNYIKEWYNLLWCHLVLRSCSEGKRFDSRHPPVF